MLRIVGVGRQRLRVLTRKPFHRIKPAMRCRPQAKPCTRSSA
jgi:hypothetical protein